MVLLTELPPEIVQHVLGYVEPSDLGWIPRVCKNLYHIVNGNTSLFRIVYLNNYDNPLNKPVVNWTQAVHDVVRLQGIGRRDRVQDKVRYFSNLICLHLLCLADSWFKIVQCLTLSCVEERTLLRLWHGQVFPPECCYRYWAIPVNNPSDIP